MKTTKRRGTDFSFLKSIIVLGSLLATLIGGDLLAKQANKDNEAQTEGSNTIIYQNSENSSVNLGDAPMIQLVIPDPITNSQSSG